MKGYQHPTLTIIVSLLMFLALALGKPHHQAQPNNNNSVTYVGKADLLGEERRGLNRSLEIPKNINNNNSSSLSLGASLVGSLESTLDAIEKVVGVTSKFSNGFGDFRLSLAISDCLELLELSSEELTWTLSAAQNPASGKGNGAGPIARRSSDMRAWLGAALGNQDTCIDGFEGTNSFVAGIVASSVNQITSLVRKMLATVVHHPTAAPPAAAAALLHHNTNDSNSSSSNNNNNYSNKSNKRRTDRGKLHNEIPAWLRPEDRKLLLETGAPSPDVTVAADGTRKYRTVMDAVLAAPDNSTRRYIIYVKKGVYHENVDIKKKKWNLMMIGDGANLTIISGNRSVADGWTTFHSATFAVSGRGFIARDVTFENTAGPEKHQAVALRSDSDLSAFFRCAFRGYQDTLYAHSLRQFYRECTITGTVDFIFGDAAAVFQNCLILARKGLPNQKNTVTAQGRNDELQATGFSFQFCNISADSDLAMAAAANNKSAVNSTRETYLGRPWKTYSRTVIMQSFIDGLIRPQGWLEWNGQFALDTLFYAEYMNYGPAAGITGRVTWPGFHAINDSSQASNFTVTRFIDGNSWLPSTGIRFSAGLSTV